MLSYRNGRKIVVCDGCYKPIGEATVLLSKEERVHMAYSSSTPPQDAYLQDSLVASGREYAALRANGWINLVFTDKRDGSKHDVHDDEATTSRVNPCCVRIMSRLPVRGRDARIGEVERWEGIGHLPFIQQSANTNVAVVNKVPAPTPEQLHYAALAGMHL